MGFDQTLATTIGILTQSILFGLAHNSEPSSEHFSSTTATGVVLGIAQACGCFREAAVAHIVYNSTLNWYQDRNE